MRNILLVAFREFWQRVRTRGFILTTLGMPLFLIIVMGGSILLESEDDAEPEQSLTQEELPAATGYVDQANLIEQTPTSLPEELFIAFPDIESANNALARTSDETSSAQTDRVRIEAYYIIPPDYRETGEIRRVSREIPAAQPDTSLFEQLLLANMVTDATEAEAVRLRSPFQSGRLIVEQMGPEEEETSPASMFMPFLVAMAIMLPLFMSGSYLLYSLSEEKSNRVMETLLVSLQPRDLLAGKLLGLGALTLVQYAAWTVLGLGIILITGQEVDTITSAVQLSTGELGLVILYGLSGYFLYAALMAGVGALSPDLNSSRSWVFVISLPMLLPIYLWTAIINSPQGALAVALSFIPFSSPLAMLMRMTAATVPGWHIITSLILLFFTSIGIVWLMARLFRVQTLLSGEPFSLNRFWKVVREG